MQGHFIGRTLAQAPPRLSSQLAKAVASLQSSTSKAQIELNNARRHLQHVNTWQRLLGRQRHQKLEKQVRNQQTRKPVQLSKQKHRRWWHRCKKVHNRALQQPRTSRKQRKSCRTRRTTESRRDHDPWSHLEDMQSPFLAPCNDLHRWHREPWQRATMSTTAEWHSSAKILPRGDRER